MSTANPFDPVQSPNRSGPELYGLSPVDLLVRGMNPGKSSLWQPQERYTGKFVSENMTEAVAIDFVDTPTDGMLFELKIISFSNGNQWARFRGQMKLNDPGSIPIKQFNAKGGGPDDHWTRTLLIETALLSFKGSRLKMEWGEGIVLATKS